MPREQINHPDPYYETDEKTGVPKRVGPADSALHVSWQADASYVQIGYESDIGTLKDLIAAADPEGGRDRLTAYTPVLNRQEINKLIRVLRRARDQAYGRDE